MVKLEFKKIQDKLELERKMKIINEGVLPDTQTDPETFAKMTAFRRDPVEAFKCHCTKCGINLCDVFNADRDQRLTVPEFKDLLQVKKCRSMLVVSLSDVDISLITLLLQCFFFIIIALLFKKTQITTHLH